jgi:uncharacterized membrane protein
MSLGSILGIVLIAVLIWAVVRWFNRKSFDTTLPTLSAIEILQQRYARGDSNAAMFEQMRTQLEAREHGSFAQNRDPVGGDR